MSNVDQWASQIGNALSFLKEPGGTDPTGITPTGDVISQVGQMSTTSGANATPQTGTLANDQYDGYQISSEYGGETGHPGLDIAVPVGTKLLTPIAGKVTHAADDDPSGYGSWVEITGTDGTVVRYGHLSGINVQPGQQVTAGTMIGLSGGTPGTHGAGNATGPHLHFEVHQGGKLVDPSSFLAGGWQVLGG